MSIIPMPDWVGRKRRHSIAEHETCPPFDLRAGAVNRINSPNFQVPEDMMQELDRALADERNHAPLGTPRRTAALIAQQLQHLREDLTDARAVVKQGEEKEASLVVELAKVVDEEIAAKKTAHDAEVAELEGLRPATGGSDEGNQTQPL